MLVDFSNLEPGSIMPLNNFNVYMMFNNVSYSTNSTRELYLNLDRTSDYTQMSNPSTTIDTSRNNFVLNL